MRIPWRCTHFRASENTHSRAAPSEQGTVLLMILLSMLAISLMSMVVAQVAATEIAISANLTAAERSFLPADGASQVLLRDLMEMTRSLGRFPTDTELDTIIAPSFTHVTLTEFHAHAVGPIEASTLTDSLYVGLSAEITGQRPEKTIIYQIMLRAFVPC